MISKLDSREAVQHEQPSPTRQKSSLSPSTVKGKGLWVLVSYKIQSKHCNCSLPSLNVVVTKDENTEHSFLVYNGNNTPEEEIQKEIEEIPYLTLNEADRILNSKLNNLAVLFAEVSLDFAEKKAKIILDITKIQQPWVDKIKAIKNTGENFGLDISDHRVALTQDIEMESSIIPLVRDFYAKLRFAYLDEIYFLFQEVEKKKPSILYDSIEFYENAVQRLHFRKSRVNVKLADGIFTCTIFLEPDKDAFECTSEILSNLKFYMKKINPKIQCGYFAIDEKTKKIFYKVSFRVISFKDFQGSFYKMLTYYLRIYYLHTENLYAICKTRGYDIRKLANEGRRMRLFNTTETIEIRLTTEQLIKERIIIEAMLKETRFLVLNNRFKHKEIEFKENFAYYKRQLFSESFEEYIDAGIDKIMDAIEEIVENLKLYNLFFKNSRFPIESFNWLREIPVYTYDQPLSEILEVLDSIPTDYSEKINENIAKDLLAKHKLSTSSSFICINQENYSLIDVTESDAKARISLYRDNRYRFVKKYHGLVQNGNKWGILCSKPMQTELKAHLHQFDLGKILELLKQIGKILNEIQAKNSLLSAVDLTCFGFCGHGSLKMWIKSPDEVKEKYQAPEVVKGKVHRNSLCFSFAVILERCIRSYYKRKYVELPTGRDFEVPDEFENKCPGLNKIHKSCLFAESHMGRMSGFEILEVFNRV